MKKMIVILLLLGLGIGIYRVVSANPIILQVFNELVFTPNGWVLEIVIPSDMNTGGWYLVTKQDTAYLKPMEISGNTPYLITQDSLLEALHIDQNGDSLSLHSSVMQMGHLNFGVSPDAEIAAPKAGQSICWTEYCFYLDNTPTLGFENDTINATGHIVGMVKTDNDIPLQGVQVLGRSSTTTDSSGFFMLSDIAWKRNIVFNKLNYITQDTIVQMWPESTITVNVKMSPVVSVERIESQAVPKDFFISEPYPNPFNPEMQIQYTLPRNGDVQIEIFDISGKLVDKIFSGFQSAGKYQAHWNAVHFPSCVYIVRIQAGEVVLSKKCALVK